jgi:hypothetical protein
VDLAVEEERGPDGTGVEEEWGFGVVEERGTDVMEEERGTDVEAHVEDAEEERAPAGVGKWQGLGLGAWVHLKRRIVVMGVDDIINAHRYIWILNACRYYGCARLYCGYVCRYCGYARRYKLLKNRV